MWCYDFFDALHFTQHLMNSRHLVHLFAVFLTAISAAHSCANPAQISSNGTGQVLIFPYYAANGRAVSLMSIANTTAQGKAFRLNFREARRGVIVAHLNVYLGSRDVWTGAVFPDAPTGGAKLVSGDTSCTAPRIPATGLLFSASGYQTDGVRGTERTREGYVEIIELATIPLFSAANANPLSLDITHLTSGLTKRRAPPCRLVVDANYTARADSVNSPSGGLSGTLSVIVVDQGLVAATPTTAIDNFWSNDSNASAARIPSLAEIVDLTSGGNRSAQISTSLVNNFVDRASYTTRSETPTPQFSPTTLLLRFDRSIDAISALLFASSSMTEYAQTSDGVATSVAVVTQPTKPYELAINTPSASGSIWNAAQSTACDYMRDPYETSTDREALEPIEFGVFIGIEPRQLHALCFAASPLIFSGTSSLSSANNSFQAVTDTSMLNSLIGFGVPIVQDGGYAPVSVGREGGWGSWLWAQDVSPDATQPRLRALTPREAFRLDTSKASPTLESVRIQLIGLPVIGFTISQFRVGLPPQPVTANYSIATPLSSRTTAIVRP